MSNLTTAGCDIRAGEMCETSLDDSRNSSLIVQEMYSYTKVLY